MFYYLIICRSLTFAQRTAAVLDKIGIPAAIQRVPRAISTEGCSHAVKIPQRKLPDALEALARVELTPKHIYITAGDGVYREVEF